ncbi:hypothetical protein [Methylorubrum extorquens]
MTMKLASTIPTTGPIRRAGNRIIVQQPGAVLDGYDFTDFYVSVAADNATLRDCLFGGVNFFTVDQQSGSGLTVDRCVFDTKRQPSKQQMAFINGRDGTLVVRRSTFVAPGSDCILISRGLIEGCTLRDPWGRPGSHSDGITVSKTTGAVVIRGDTIDWRPAPGSPGGVTNAIRIASIASVRDVTVEGNTILGGTYTLFAGLDPAGKASTCERITIRDNIVDAWDVRTSWLYPTSRARDLVCEGNRTAAGDTLVA